MIHFTQHSMGGEGASGLHCSLSGNVPGVDCSKEEGKGSVCGGLCFIHISTACLYLEDPWSTQSWLQHS